MKFALNALIISGIVFSVFAMLFGFVGVVAFLVISGHFWWAVVTFLVGLSIIVGVLITAFIEA